MQSGQSKAHSQRKLSQFLAAKNSALQSVTKFTALQLQEEKMTRKGSDVYATKRNKIAVRLQSQVILVLHFSFAYSVD